MCLALLTSEEGAMTTRLLASVVVFISSIGVVDAARRVTIPEGTALRVRLDTTVASNTSRIEDQVYGRLVNPIVINGRTVVPAGSKVVGTVVNADRSNRVKGRASLALRFNELTLAGDNETYRIRTRTWSRTAEATKGEDATKIAVPAVGGAVIGALAGGKKGAAIGGAVGGGAGTALVLSTRGQEVRLGRGSVLLVRLSSPLSLD
jgi:hypothetical protein